MHSCESTKKVCDRNVHRRRLLDGRSMTSGRDDLQARASDTLMQALGVDRRNSDILVSDKNQCRNPNPVDLVVYPFAGDDSSGRPCHTKSMISAHTMSPLAALLNARRVGEKRPPEHDVQQVLSKNAAIACSCPIPEHSRKFISNYPHSATVLLASARWSSLLTLL